MSILETQLQNSFCNSIDLTGGRIKSPEHNWTVVNTNLPMTASARTAVGHNRPSSLHNVNDSDMSDVESSQSASNMNGDDEEYLDDPRIAPDEKVRSTSIDVGESEDYQEISFTEQVRNKLYNLAINNRAGTARPADPILGDSLSDSDIIDQDYGTHETLTVHTSTYKARNLGVDRVDEFSVVNNVQSLKTINS